MNKRAEEKLLSLWWFFVLFLIAGGIVLGFSIFNSAEIDVRELEADILATKIVDCVVENGYLKQELLDEDLLETCGINKEVIEKEEIYHLSLELYNLDKCELLQSEEKFKFEKLKCEENLLKEPLNFGSNVEEQCKTTKTAETKNYPKCSEKFVYVLGENNEKRLLYVLAASNQEGGKEMIK